MTAIIAILNKSCVGVAADSAVSVSSENNRKVYNYANKIFNLAIGSPIALMIYNNAEFVDIPWETIIKMYRVNSNNKTFEKVTGYRDDFLSYLQSFKKYFAGDEEEKTIHEITLSLLTSIESDINQESDKTYTDKDLLVLSESQKRTHYHGILSSLLERDLETIKSLPYHDGFDHSDLIKIKDSFQKIVDGHIEEFLSFHLLQDDVLIKEQLNSLVFENTVRQIFLESSTGLAFTGFGETEIFPSLYSLTVGGVLNGKIRFQHEQDHSQIDSNMTASIVPFAQTDIMQTFVEGIDPWVKFTLPQAFRSALQEFNQHILSKIDYSTDSEKKLKSVLDQAIPDTVNSLVNRLEELRAESHINPMLRTISSLSKEDIAEMAESLINLTYLKRRASFSEESVGGPIDVAVITKGDGFIWIKRKHYFDPALNLNYIAKVNTNKGTI